MDCYNDFNMDQQNFFEHEALEADIKSLAREIGRSKELPENKGIAGQELLKKAIQALPLAGAAPPAAVSEPPRKSPLPDYAQSASAEVKLEIEYLLDMAFHAGIAKAAAEAKKSPDFVQDAFHDALAGKLYPELQKRGILK